METIAVERSIWINAPRERVWDAITNPEQIAQWFVPNLPGAKMKRDEVGKVTIYLGEMGVDFIILDIVDSPRQAVFRSLPDRLIATAYTLDEEKMGTRVTITMTGFDALPADARQDRLDQSGAGWHKALENLKAFVDGVELPFPAAFVGPLFGFWRESRNMVAIERSIWIDAPRERVWTAITDPAHIASWFSPGTQWRGTGLKVGGTISVYNPETDTDMYVQVIDVVDPPHKLATRSVPEAQETPHITTWTLTEENGGTRLTLTHSGYELESEEARWQSMEQNAFGFGMMLENLKAVVEGQSLPFPGGF